MKRKSIMSEVELSYEELQYLEAHFRQLQKEMVVHTLEQAPGLVIDLLAKIASAFRSNEQLKQAKTGS